MKTKENYGSDYPPGVTANDIERAFGEDDEGEPCPSCGAINYHVVNGKCTVCHCSLKEYDEEV